MSWNNFKSTLNEVFNDAKKAIVPDILENNLQVSYKELSFLLGAVGFPAIAENRMEVCDANNRHYADLTISNLEDGQTIDLKMTINDYQKDGSFQIYKTHLSATKVSGNMSDDMQMELTKFIFENEDINLKDRKRIADILTSKLFNQVRSFPRASLTVNGGIHVYANAPSPVDNVKQFFKKRFGR